MPAVSNTPPLGTTARAPGANVAHTPLFPAAFLTGITTAPSAPAPRAGLQFTPVRRT